jgi:hypothetical protein
MHLTQLRTQEPPEAERKKIPVAECAGVDEMVTLFTSRKNYDT